MFDVLFSSIALQICGICFVIFVTAIFLKNKNSSSFTIIIFKFLLLFTFLVNIFEIATYGCDYYFGEFKTVTNILSRLFILNSIFWFATFCIYILSKFIYEDIDNNKEKAKKITLIFSIIAVVLFLVTCFFKIDLHVGQYNESLYVLGGPILYPIYAYYTIGFVLLIYSYIKKFKTLDTIQKAVIIFIHISYIVLIIVESVTEYDISDLSYIMSIYTVSFYFTIEGTDYKAVFMLKKAKNEVEEKNKEIYNYINEMSKNIINPLNNMLILTNNMKLNPKLNGKEIRQNLEHIINENEKVFSNLKGGDTK